MDASASSESDKLAVCDTVTEASRLATWLKVEAFYRAESQIVGVFSNRPQRSLLVGYLALASELANPTASHTYILAKQLSRGQSGAQLALSDLLKDTGPDGLSAPIRLVPGAALRRCSCHRGSPPPGPGKTAGRRNGGEGPFRQRCWQAPRRVGPR